MGEEDETTEARTKKPKAKKKNKKKKVTQTTEPETTEPETQTNIESGSGEGSPREFLDTLGQSLGSLGASIPDVIDNAFGRWHAPNFGHVGGFFNQTTSRPHHRTEDSEERTTEADTETSSSEMETETSSSEMEVEVERGVSFQGLGNLLGGSMTADLINQAAASGNLNELARLASHLPPGTLASLLKSSLSAKAKQKLSELGFDETTEETSVTESRMLDGEEGDVEQSVGMLNELASEGSFKKLISAVARMPSTAFNSVILPLLSPSAKQALEKMGLLKESEAESTDEVTMTDMIIEEETRMDTTEKVSRDLTTEEDIIHLWVIEFERAAELRDIWRLQQLDDALPEDGLEVLIAPWLDEPTVVILKELGFLDEHLELYPRFHPEYEVADEIIEDKRLERAKYVYDALRGRGIPSYEYHHHPPPLPFDHHHFHHGPHFA